MNYKSKSDENQQLLKLYIVSVYRHKPAVPSSSRYHRSERKRFALETPDSVNHLAYLYAWLQLLLDPNSWLSRDFVTVISEKRTCKTGGREIKDWEIGNDIPDKFLDWLEHYHPVTLAFSFYETVDSISMIWTVTVRLQVERAVHENG